MGKFLVGLLLGIAAGGGGTYVYLVHAPSQTALAMPDAAVAVASAGKKKRGTRPAGGGGEVGEVTLTADDTKMAAKGPALQVGARSLDMAEGAEETRDLSQSEIDATFGQKSAALVACIETARGRAPVGGAIIMQVLVTPDGGVAKSRIKAPNYLLTHGLYACANSQLRVLSFPKTGKETVVSVPFNLE